jgi:hypothetical protein
MNEPRKRGSSALGRAIVRAEAMLELVGDSDWTPQDAALDHLIRAARKVEENSEWGTALMVTGVPDSPLIDVHPHSGGEAGARSGAGQTRHGGHFIIVPVRRYSTVWQRA